MGTTQIKGPVTFKTGYLPKDKGSPVLRDKTTGEIVVRGGSFTDKVNLHAVNGKVTVTDGRFSGDCYICGGMVRRVLQSRGTQLAYQRETLKALKGETEISGGHFSDHAVLMSYGKLEVFDGRFSGHCSINAGLHVPDRRAAATVYQAIAKWGYTKIEGGVFRDRASLSSAGQLHVKGGVFSGNVCVSGGVVWKADLRHHSHSDSSVHTEKSAKIAVNEGTTIIYDGQFGGNAMIASYGTLTIKKATIADDASVFAGCMLVKPDMLLDSLEMLEHGKHFVSKSGNTTLDGDTKVVGKTTLASMGELELDGTTLGPNVRVLAGRRDGFPKAIDGTVFLSRCKLVNDVSIQSCGRVQMTDCVVRDNIDIAAGSVDAGKGGYLGELIFQGPSLIEKNLDFHGDRTFTEGHYKGSRRTRQRELWAGSPKPLADSGR